MKTKETGLIVVLTAALICMNVYAGDNNDTDLLLIKKEVPTGFCNGGWAYGRYSELETLDAGKSITVADLKGPGIIKHFHTTRHHYPDISTRGVVLLIYFDNEKTPAVQCPLGDFFGDGCNGKSMNFSTPLIECAPGSYNMYIPIAFKTAIKVVLRNDTEKNLKNYSYFEWEPLEKWNPEFGYFHATYQRKVFQLTKDSKEVFFHTKGSGHILGRQFSVTTDEEKFRGFHFVMEGNNEVDIDGQERKLDYLGSEDSFTFSWGFRRTFAGNHAGMTFLKKDEPMQMLSMYRFHDYMPIRFKKELTWSINWLYEDLKHPEFHVKMQQIKASDGAWVDYATVFYWYQDSPAGFQHQPLRPVAERMSDLLKSSRKKMPEAAKTEVEKD